MGKSIRTTSNTQTATNSTIATFKADDAVLCPFLGTNSYQLFNDDENGYLSFIVGVNKYHTLSNGKQHPKDKSPSIFHDTPANRQIITALYDQVGPTPSQRKVIDATSPDDEVAMLSTAQLSSIAFDIEHATETIDDIGQTLALIHYDKVPKFTAASLARLAHSSANTWAEILDERLEYINKALAMTAYAKEVTN